MSSSTLYIGEGFLLSTPLPAQPKTLIKYSIDPLSFCHPTPFTHFLRRANSPEQFVPVAPPPFPRSSSECQKTPTHVCPLPLPKSKWKRAPPRLLYCRLCGNRSRSPFSAIPFRGKKSPRSRQPADLLLGRRGVTFPSFTFSPLGGPLGTQPRGSLSLFLRGRVKGGFEGGRRNGANGK